MISAEAEIIAALASDNALIREITVTGDQFQSRTLAQVFDAARMLIAEGRPVDPVTLVEHLNNTTGRDWLGSVIGLLDNTIGSAANVGAYCELIRRSHMERQAMSIAKTMMENVREEGAVDQAIRDLMALTLAGDNHEYTIKQGMKKAIEELDRAFRNGGKIVGVPTGITDLDDLMGGLHGGDLTVIGARPAMGKTAVMLNMARRAGCPVGVISGEQGVSQACSRILAAESNISLMLMRSGKLQEEHWPKLSAGAYKVIDSAPIYFYDAPAPHIDDVVRVARRWKFNYSIRALYIDYLQRLKGDPKLPKHERVGDIAKALKELARELDIPVVCLAQVNRGVDTRACKRPVMGDLKDSGDIEQEADEIILLYRDEAYNPDTNDKGIIEFIIDKNRHGATGIIKAVWNEAYVRVDNLDHSRLHEEYYA